MRLFIDTDVLLDTLLRREPYFKHSAAILDWAGMQPNINLDKTSEIMIQEPFATS